MSTIRDRRTAESRARAAQAAARITPQQDAALRAAAEADPDNPPVTDETVARARMGRPPLAPEARKQQITMRLDADLVAALKAGGRGWQSRANAALRKAVLGER